MWYARPKIFFAFCLSVLLFIPCLSYAACTSPAGVAGEMGYEITSPNALEYCNNTNWISGDAGLAPTVTAPSDENIPAAISIETDLIGHWRLDETSGSSIADSSGNANTGTWTDAVNDDVAEETGIGKSNKALIFDGADDYVNAGSGAGIDDVFTGGGTISAWIYPLSYGEGNYGRILAKGWSSDGWHFHMDGSTGQAFDFSFNCSGSGNTWWRTTSGTLPINQWSHVVLTFNADSVSNAPTFYVNGTPVSFTTTGSCAAFSSDAANDLYIGNTSTSTRAYDGSIDDVRIYDRELTATEISYLYTTTNDLVGHWKLDETSGSAIADSSGTGNNGIWYDGVNDDIAEETIASPVGTGINPDGSNDYIEILDNDTLDITGAVTVSAWVKYEGSDGGVACKQNASNANSDNYCIYIDVGGYYAFALGDGSGSQYAASATVSDGNWHHFTGVADGTNITLYEDGVQIYQTAQTRTLTAFTTNFYIGTYDSAVAGRSIDGDIADVRVYARALTSTEIALLYNQSEGHALVGHWKLDETSGSAIADSSTKGHTGTWSDGSGDVVTEEALVAKRNTGLNFDGVNDYIDIGNPTTYQFTDSMSVMAWVKGDVYPEIKHIVSKQGDTPDYGWRLATSGADSPFVIGVTSTGASMVDRKSTTIPEVGLWYHVAGVYNSSSLTLDIYVNGVLDNGTLSGAVPASQFNSSVNVNIGKRAAGANRRFDGVIDDVRVYNYALTASEISAIYNSAQSYGLVAHWKLDETSGTVVADSSGNGYNGIMFGGLNAGNDSVVGKVGTALNFSRTGDRIDVGDVLNMGTQDLSLSAWIKPDDCPSSEIAVINKRENLTAADGYSLRVSCSGGNVVQSAFGATATSTYHAQGSSDLLDSQWHHVGKIRRALPCTE